MRVELYAQELARRLNQTEVAQFHAEADAVLLGGDYYVPLRIVDAGAGRREQVERALERARVLSPHIPVVVGRHFTRTAIEVLTAAEANYMDDRHLRVRLETPSILVRLTDEAEPLPESRASTLKLSGAAGGVALALLGDPGRDWKITDLANVGKAALGTAQNTVVGLEVEGLVERVGRGPATRRRVTDPAGLLDLYAADAVADRKVRGRGFLLNNGAEETMRAVSDSLKRSLGSGVDVCFTGVAAAQLIAPHVTAVRNFEVWVTAPHRVETTLQAMGAVSAEEGGANLVILQGSSAVLVGANRDHGGIRLSSVFRVYADALAEPLRGEEQAEHLRRTTIGF